MTRIRLPGPILEAARSAGAESGRPVEAQVDHWVRIGRAIERSGLYSHLELSELLARGDVETPEAPSP